MPSARELSVPPPPRAFSLIELLVIIALIALLISILLPSLGKARRGARSAACMGRMQQLALGVLNYAGDARGSVASFSWMPGSQNSSFSDLNDASTDYLAHADQAVDIVRRRTGKITQPRIVLPNPRLVDRDFTHLVLIDGGYFGSEIPDPSVVCPEDTATLLWQRSGPDKMVSLRSSGQAPFETAEPFLRLLPFAASFQAVPYTFASDSRRVDPRTNESTRTVSQNPSEHRLYEPGLLPLGGRRIEEVSFPSQKVAYFDLFDRHRSSRTLFYAYPQAAAPLAFFDGSVRVFKTADTNQGWNPNTPDSPEPTRYTYFPGYWGRFDPPTLSGQPSDPVVGYYRWTRKGLRGIDVGGKIE